MSAHDGSPFCLRRIIFCIRSIIGVKGFLISWATCLAISFHALSLSASASLRELSESFFTILL